MRPTPVAHPPAGARYICPGHVGIVPSFPRRDPRLPRPVGIAPSLSFSPPVPVCVAAGFSPPSFFPLSTANFRPLHPLSPLECADPQIAPITPLDCAVPKKVGGGDKLLTRNLIRITVVRSIAGRLFCSVALTTAH